MYGQDIALALNSFSVLSLHFDLRLNSFITVMTTSSLQLVIMVTSFLSGTNICLLSNKNTLQCCGNHQYIINYHYSKTSL